MKRVINLVFVSLLFYSCSLKKQEQNFDLFMRVQVEYLKEVKENTAGYLLVIIQNKSEDNYYINHLDGRILNVYGVNESGLIEKLNDREDIYAGEKLEPIYEKFSEKYNVHSSKVDQIKIQLIEHMDSLRNAINDRKRTTSDSGISPEEQLYELMLLPAKREKTILVADLQAFKEAGFNELQIEYGYIPIPLKVAVLPDGIPFVVSDYLEERGYHFFDKVICPVRKTIRLK